MRIEFWGATGITTGSRHLVSVNKAESVFLLECGLFQGRRAEARELNLNFPFHPEYVNALVLSHAHIDHSGNIPNLVKQGFNGNIFCTSATLDLCNAMLRDSAHIQEKDVEYVNKRHRRKGIPEVEPLYTIPDAERAMEFFHSVYYHRWFELVNGVRIRFLDAGHILGSAIVEMVISEKNEQEKRLVFTGDLGRKNLPILRDPQIPEEGADYLIIESTYGGRRHRPIEQAKDRLCEFLCPVLEQGGKVIVPSFAVERTQELVYCLKALWDEGRLPRVPVFVDSPLAVNITEVFRLHPECFDSETRDIILQADDPFGFSMLTYIRDVEKSKALNEMPGPMIIISASGMCEAGRILHHLKNNIEDPKNLILIVGFQAQNTLGRRIVERYETVNIFGEPYKLRAQVAVMNEFSAHADTDELVEFIIEMNRRRPLKKVILVHGEPDQTEALANRIKSELKIDIFIPSYGDHIEL